MTKSIVSRDVRVGSLVRTALAHPFDDGTPSREPLCKPTKGNPRSCTMMRKPPAPEQPGKARPSLRRCHF